MESGIIGGLRQEISRMVEGYDAADASKASTFALRDELTSRGPGRHGRIAGGSRSTGRRVGRTGAS
jgi:hypothetical protein